MGKIKKYFWAGFCVAGMLFSMTGCGEDYTLSEIEPETMMEDVSEDKRTEDSQVDESELADGDGEENNDAVEEEISQDGATGPEESLQPRDFDTIKEYLGTYSNELHELNKTESFIILHGTYHSGKEYWDAFLESVDKGEPAEVVMVQFTVEGDAILYYLQYNGRDFYAVEDYSRDAWSAEPGYLEKTLPYLSVLENDWEGDRYWDIVLTDRENLTVELLEQYWDNESLQEEMEVFWIGSLSMGDEDTEALDEEITNLPETKYDESEILIPAEQVKEIEIINGLTGDRITLTEGEQFEEILEAYANLDVAPIEPVEEAEQMLGYAYAMNLKDENGELLQQVTPYKNAVVIGGEVYDGSANGTTMQLLGELEGAFGG